MCYLWQQMILFKADMKDTFIVLLWFTDFWQSFTNFLKGHTTLLPEQRQQWLATHGVRVRLSWSLGTAQNWKPKSASEVREDDANKYKDDR